MLRRRTSKFLAVLLSLCMLLSSMPGVFATAADGELTQADGYYLIYTADDLMAYNDIVNGGTFNASAKLMADIDMKGKDWLPLGVYSDVGGYSVSPFYGTFDGNGFIINNLTVYRDTPIETGFFSRTQNATVKNVTIANASITNTANARSGILGGEMYISTVENCFTHGTVTVTKEASVQAGSGNQIGGIAGEAANTTLKNCGTSLSVVGNNTSLENCFYVSETDNGVSGAKNIPSADMIPTGEAAYLMNEALGTTFWYQNTDATYTPDPAPVASTNGGRGVVYKVNKQLCVNYPDTLVVAYSNTDADITTTSHDFVNGICSVCGEGASAEDLEIIKADLIEALNNYVDLDDYLAEQQNEITTIIAEATVAINAAESYTEINAAYDDATAQIDEVKVAEVVLREQLRPTAEAKVQALYDSVDYTLYYDTQDAVINDIIEKASEKIYLATTSESIDSLYATAQSDINNVPKITYIDEKVASLESSVDLSLYYEEQQNQINEAIATGTAAIKASSTTSEADTAYNNATRTINGILTAEMTDFVNTYSDYSNGLAAYDGFIGNVGPIEGQHTGVGFMNGFDFEGGKENIQISIEDPMRYDNLLSSPKYFTYKNSAYRSGRSFAPWGDSSFDKLGIASDGLIGVNGSEQPVYMSWLMRTNGGGTNALEFHQTNGFWHGGSRRFAVGSFNSEDGIESSSVDGKNYWSLRIGPELGDSNQIIRTTKEFDKEETVLVVLKIEFNYPEESKISLYLNPDLTQELPEEADAVATSLADMRFRGMTNHGNSELDIDELRVGTSYEAVTPLSTYKFPVTKIKLTGDVEDLKGSTIMGSNESATSGFETIAKIPEDITSETVEITDITNTNAYRYVKYYGKAGTYGKLSEMELYSGIRKLEGEPFGTVADEGYDETKAFDGDVDTYYMGQVADDQYVGLDLGGETSVAEPTTNIEPGRYEEALSIELKCDTEGAEIYYTTDGTVPTKTNGTLYDGTPIEVAMGSSVLIKAIAYKSGLFDSDMMVAGFGAGAEAPVAQGLQVYMMGNSLTDTVVNGTLSTVAQSAGFDHKSHKLSIPGAAIVWHYTHKDGAFGTWVSDPGELSTEQTEEFSEVYNEQYYFNPDNARYTVEDLAPLDIMTVQPFNNGDFYNSKEDNNVIEVCQYYYEMANKYNPGIRFLLYSSWGALSNEDEAWGFEGSNDSYVALNENISRDMTELYPDAPAFNIIPNTHALEELKRQIKSGEFPKNADGTDVTDFVEFTSADAETDSLHLNENGKYLIACTTFVTMYKTSPVGLITYKPDSLTDEQALALQNIAYDVNINYPYSGVSVTASETSEPIKPSVNQTKEPTVPTEAPIVDPTVVPTTTPELTPEPTEAPVVPTEEPVVPTEAPVVDPTVAPTTTPELTPEPTEAPIEPTEAPVVPTEEPVVSEDILLAYDSFDDVAGTPLKDHTGDFGWKKWTVQNNPTEGYIIKDDNPLAYSNLSTKGNYASGGQSYLTSVVNLDTSSDALSPYLNGSNVIGNVGTSMWVSFLMRIESESTAVRITDDASDTNWNVEDVAIGRTNASSEYISMKYQDSQTAVSNVPLSSDTMFYAVKYEFISDSSTKISVWINPTLGEEPTGEPDMQITTEEFVGIRDIKWVPHHNSDKGSLDEIRVGTSFNAVAPISDEPMVTEEPVVPTEEPVVEPTVVPTTTPELTPEPTEEPVVEPTVVPTTTPELTPDPTEKPVVSTEAPVVPTEEPVVEPTLAPTEEPSGDGYSNDGFAADGSLEPAELVNGVYEIGNVGQLYWFANLVNTSSDKAIDAKLIDDIDMNVTLPDGLYWQSIGITPSYSGVSSISDFGYLGHFDGNNKTISNFVQNENYGSINISGLFGTVGGTVEKLTIESAYVKVGNNDGRFGIIAGQVVTDGKVIDCAVYNSEIDCVSRVAGAVTGGLFGGTVENCLVVGTTAKGGRVGIVVGDSRTDANALYGTTINCYTDGGSVCSSQGGNTSNAGEANVTAARLASGEIAYKLNADRDPAVWGQNIDSDEGEHEAVPVVGGFKVMDHGMGYYSNKEYDQEAALQSAKEKAIDQLNNYVDLSLYRAEQQATINDIIATATAAINAAEDTSSVDTIYATAIAEIDEVRTDVEMREDDWNQDYANGLVKNRVLNGSFDSKDLTYWDTSTLTGGYEIIDNQFNSDNVLMLNPGSGYIMQLVSVEPGKLYKFSYDVHTIDGLPVMSVRSYDMASDALGGYLCENGWNQPGEWLETRSYTFYDSSSGRSEYFSAEGDVVAVVMRASGSAPVYLDNIKLEGVEPAANEQFLNMNNNMVEDQDYIYTTDNHEIVEYSGREMVHLYKTDNGDETYSGGGVVYKWTRVVPGRKYIVGGLKASTDLNEISLYTVDEEGNLKDYVSGHNWAHGDVRHYAMGTSGGIGDRSRAYIPGEDVYGIAIVGRNDRGGNCESWYSDFYIYDVTESYAFDAEDVPSVVAPDGAISTVSGNTIDIQVPGDASTIEIASYDGSKVEYYADQYAGIEVEPSFSGLEIGTAQTIYAKVYSRYNAQARIYTVNVSMIDPDATPVPTVEPTPEVTVAPTEEPVVPTEAPVVPTEEPTLEVTPTPEATPDVTEAPTEEPVVEYVTVEYKDINNNTVKRSNIVKGGAIGTLPTMFRDGYVFEGWYLGTEKIDETLIVDEAIVLKPKFVVETKENSVNTYSVVVGETVEFSTINGFEYIDGMEEELTLADKVVLKMKDTEGKEVDYWTVNGQVISNDQTLSFMVQPGEMRVEAVLKDIDAANTKVVDPNVIITSTVSRPDHNNRFYVYSMRVIEDPADVVECGVIIMRGTNAEETPDFTLETDGIHQIRSSRQGSMGEYAIVRKDTETQYSVRSYMKYLDADGNEQIVYSDAVTVLLDVQQ